MNSYYRRKAKDSEQQAVYLIWLVIITMCIGTWYCTYRWVTHKCLSPAVLMEVTAYCACEKCCGKWSDGYTASGHKIQVGDKFVAAPKHIPFGTMLNIPGYGIVPVLDRGGAIKVGRLDVFFESHQEALNWGIKHLVIKLL